MKKIGLTGGIGSGKSTVSKIFLEISSELYIGIPNNLNSLLTVLFPEPIPPVNPIFFMVKFY